MFYTRQDQSSMSHHILVRYITESFTSVFLFVSLCWCVCLCQTVSINVLCVIDFIHHICFYFFYFLFFFFYYFFLLLLSSVDTVSQSKPHTPIIIIKLYRNSILIPISYHCHHQMLPFCSNITSTVLFLYSPLISIRYNCLFPSCPYVTSTVLQPAAGAKRIPINLNLMGKNSSAFQGFKAIKMAEVRTLINRI